MLKKVIYLFIVIVLFGSFMSMTTPWGFYGHRLINRLAVYTVPSPLVKLYKDNIEYIAEHAVDPDKRRYATKHEGVRHYIDIDVWGDNPFEDVPRTLSTAVVKYSDFYFINGLDTLSLIKTIKNKEIQFRSNVDSTLLFKCNDKTFRYNFVRKFMPFYYEDDWIVSSTALDSLDVNFDPNAYPLIMVKDLFSEQGILPFHLEKMQRRLTQAYVDRDKAKILRLSSEYGHYIGDAHVPLHTTVNYNGQLTDQVGIHAFWESRIPELFAEQEYDFLVGSARYVENIRSYVWGIVEDSHAELDSVLLIEKELSQTYPSDKQFCYDERLGRTIRIQCTEYAAAYQERMAGMVERRMQASIKAIGDLWYTAWVDAGQPDIEDLDIPFVDTTEVIIINEKLKGVREHSF